MLDAVLLVAVAGFLERAFALTILRLWSAGVDHDRFYAAYGRVSVPRSLFSLATGAPAIASAWLGMDRDVSLALSLACLVAVMICAVHDGLRARKSAALD